MPRLEDFEPRLVELAGFARALSHPARILILRLLATRDEMAAMAVVRELPLSQPACSRHLRELADVGLIRARSDQSHVFYRLEREALDQFCEAMSSTLHAPKTQSTHS
jgi:DNA-binding transcriptional ArsR family regulator